MARRHQARGAVARRGGKNGRWRWRDKREALLVE
jgi:hypothetical protein